MKLKEVLDKTVQFYRDKKVENARLEAEWLFASTLKLDRVQLYLKFDQPLKDEELQTLRESIKRRVAGEPLAYITGSRGFYGYEFKVTPDVLIPRPETETLVEKVLEKIKSLQQDTVRILDLGCGSGCIGLTLAKKDSRVKVDLVDISSQALEVTQQNAKNLGVLEQCRFVNQDAKEFLKLTSETYDIIVANPPYIHPDDEFVDDNVKKFEPHQALFATDGTSALKEWSSLAVDRLGDTGFMMMEMGYDQGPEMKSHFENLKVFSKVEVIQDLSHKDRIISGEIHG